MRSAHPTGLELSVTGCTVEFGFLLWGIAFLRLCYHQGDTGCQQSKNYSDKQSFDT
jgi:hypothetical protein